VVVALASCSGLRLAITAVDNESKVPGESEPTVAGVLATGSRHRMLYLFGSQSRQKRQKNVPNSLHA
jgi:hypothetical protein